MSKFLHDAHDAKATAIPCVFSENSQAKKLTPILKVALQILGEKFYKNTRQSSLYS